MLILKILFVLSCILLLLLLFILLVPFGYKVKAVSLGEKSVRFRAFWLFGMFRFSGSYVLYQGFESRIHILGLKIKTRQKDRDKREKTKKDKKKKKKSFSAEAIKQILVSGKKVFLHLMPNKIEGYGRLGFNDPYYTGITCSFVEMLRGLRFHNLNLDYVFEDEVYEGEIYIEGRIFIFYIVYIAIRLLLNRPTRKLILN